MNSQERRTFVAAEYPAEYRRVLAGLTPNCPERRYSGAQLAYARGVARRNILERLDG